MGLDVSALFDDPLQLDKWDQEALFSISPGDLAEAQLRGLQTRYEQMRPQVRLVDRLADDIGVRQIDRLDDITALCVPHTTYKSYSVTYLEQGRYDKLTRWLSGVTAHDLSALDASGCSSLETWMDALEAASPLRPLSSSGTSGKMSFFPRSTVEEQFFIRWHLLQHGPYRDEADSNLASGEVDYYTPWPVSTGHHNMPTLFGLLRKHVFGGDASRMHILGRGHWDLDLMWLSSRLRAAEARGELAQLELTPAMKELQSRLAHQQQNVEQDLDGFLDELFVQTKGQRIFLLAPYAILIPLAQEAKKRGLRAEFSPDSYVLGGGGAKGTPFPDGWFELCKEIVPYDHQAVYGMTELTGSGRKCSAGKYHFPPWIVTFLLDPDTSMPLPREGVQTGRFAAFDLWPQTYWGGSITGDRSTIDWRGNCPCGRQGAFVETDITRYSNLRDDDKISCSKSPDAYSKAIELTLAIA